MSAKLKIVGIGVLAFGLMVCIFVRIMNYDMRRDEQLYAPPAVLLEDGNLYTDFFYNHVPGSAWLFRIMHQALFSDHILLSSRLGVFCGWILLAVAIGWVAWTLTRSRALTLFATLSLVSNDVFLSVVGMTATNNFLPAPFAFLGLALFIFGVTGRDIRDRHGSHQQALNPKASHIFAAGIMLSIAASIKVSAGGYILPVVVAAFLLPAGIAFTERLKRVVAPLAVGGLLGGAPVLLVMLRNPEVFFAHVLGFHTGPHVAYWAAQPGGESVAMSLGAKLLLAFQVFLSGANVVVVLILLMLMAFYALQMKTMRRFLGSDGVLLFLVSVAVLTLGLSFAPTPSFPQYFAPPLVAAPLIAAWLYAKLNEDGKPFLNVLLLAGSFMMLVLNAPRLGQHLPKLPQPEKWTVNRVHDQGQKIAAEMEKAGLDGKVATLLPVYPLEGGLPVYEEFATGQFAYRIADMTDQDLLRHYRTTSPQDVAAMLAADPPDAILVGFEPILEAPLVRFAEEHGYRRVEGFSFKDRYGRGVIYLRRR